MSTEAPVATKRPIKDRVSKALVKNLLEHPESMDWTLQGFGMLRCYLEPELRLHVWDSRFRFAEVSDLHTHPWDFHSVVVAGVVRNKRFREVTQWEAGGEKLRRQTIRCGVGGGLTGDPEDVRLSGSRFEVLEEGATYTQHAREIHRSVPEDGSVTIIEREFKDDTEHAYVYFEGEWVTAEPRPATEEEIDSIVANSLAAWF
jgi:hypothetical protein